MVLCKLHLCRSMVGNWASYNPIAVQMLSSLKELTMPWYNFGFALFVYFVSKSKETSGEWPFCTYGRKQCLCLIHLAKKLAFKNNKNRNFKILYLNCQPELTSQTNFQRKFIQFALKRHGAFQVPSTGNCATYNGCCCSKASKTQRTDDEVVNFFICFFWSILLQNKKKTLEKGLLALYKESNGFVSTIWLENSLKNWDLNTTKNKTSKYCISNFRQNLDANLNSWGSSSNLFETAWSIRSSTCVDSQHWILTPTTPLLFHLAQDLAFTNNKNQNLKILYLNC